MIFPGIVVRTRRCSYLFANRISNLTFRRCDSDEAKTDKEAEKDGKKDEYPEEPTTCCMSGCANCVWLEYAQKLSEYYKDGGEEAFKQIEDRVTDPNMKAFLLHELRMRKK